MSSRIPWEVTAQGLVPDSPDSLFLLGDSY